MRSLVNVGKRRSPRRIYVSISLQPTVPNAIDMGFLSVGTGEILAALAAVALAASTIIGKLKLFQVPLGIYTIFRTGLGTVIFFFAALLLYGRHHFIDAFSPFSVEVDVDLWFSNCRGWSVLLDCWLKSCFDI